MPKVYTRAVVSSSDRAAQSQSSRAVLRSYYCLCGDFLLVIQGKLERLPRRRSDGAYILRSKSTSTAVARKFKLNAQPGQRVLVHRARGGLFGGDKSCPERATAAEGDRAESQEDLEMRQTFCCGRCKTPVAYQVPPPPAGAGPFLYVLPGAMTELQGRVPANAFEGEAALLRAVRREEARETSKLSQRA